MSETSRPSLQAGTTPTPLVVRTFNLASPATSNNEQRRTINLRCPICGHAGAFHGVAAVRDANWQHVVPNEKGGHAVLGNVTIGIRQCPNADCNAFVFIELYNGTVVDTYPPRVIDFDSTNLPPNLLATLEEAIQCHAAGCYRASALMVRRLLEELCAEKGATGDNLKKRIAALSAFVVVPPDLLEAADELRLLGNDAAHIEATLYDKIGAEEVELAIELAKELLKAVYQLSSLVARLKGLKRPEAS